MKLINIYTVSQCVYVYKWQASIVLIAILSFFGYPVHLDQVLRNESGMSTKECSFSPSLRCPFESKSIAFVEGRKSQHHKKLKEWQNKSEKTGSCESFKSKKTDLMCVCDEAMEADN